MSKQKKSRFGLPGSTPLAPLRGDFTPGAGLDPQQIDRVMAFATCRGRTNDETLANMAAFFTAPKQEAK